MDEKKGFPDCVIGRGYVKNPEFEGTYEDWRRRAYAYSTDAAEKCVVARACDGGAEVISAVVFVRDTGAIAEKHVLRLGVFPTLAEAEEFARKYRCHVEFLLRGAVAHGREEEKSGKPPVPTYLKKAGSPSDREKP